MTWPHDFFYEGAASYYLFPLVQGSVAICHLIGILIKYSDAKWTVLHLSLSWNDFPLIEDVLVFT